MKTIPFLKMTSVIVCLVASNITAAHANKWHGFYAGGMVGLESIDLDTIGTSNLASLTSSVSQDSFTGDLYAGYNIPVGSLLFGVEGHIGYGGTDTSIDLLNNSDLISFNVQNNFTAGLRGRVGVLWNDLLLYGTGGVAYSNLSLDLNTTFSGTQTSLNKTDNVMGYSFGAGAELMVLNSFILRAEYLFTDYDALDFSSIADSGSATTSTHDFKVGVALKF